MVEGREFLLSDFYKKVKGKKAKFKNCDTYIVLQGEDETGEKYETKTYRQKGGVKKEYFDKSKFLAGGNACEKERRVFSPTEFRDMKDVGPYAESAVWALLNLYFSP